jgi:hypothetical protein
MNPSHRMPLGSEHWKSLYEDVVSESEYSPRLDRIADARNAIFDRAEEILTHPSTDEQRALSNALRTLRTLEQRAIRKAEAA